MPVDAEGQIADRSWYHTIELPGGRVTPGIYDLRPALRRVPLPASLVGRRCLDVGTHDGFWAFEMERRGATEVVSIDLLDVAQYDYAWPRGEISPEDRTANDERLQGFTLARDALRSSVERIDMSVYDLDPTLVGQFDFAVIGTLLLHLRDPVRALHAVSKVLTGQLLVNEAISLSLSVLRPRTPTAKLAGLPGAPYWWNPNVAGLKQLLVAGGYRIVSSSRPYLLRNGRGFRMPEPGSLIRPPFARRQGLKRGLPHAWVLAEPDRRNEPA